MATTARWLIFFFASVGDENFEATVGTNTTLVRLASGHRRPACKGERVVGPPCMRVVGVTLRARAAYAVLPTRLMGSSTAISAELCTSPHASWPNTAKVHAPILSGCMGICSLIGAAIGTQTWLVRMLCTTPSPALPAERTSLGLLHFFGKRVDVLLAGQDE